MQEITLQALLEAGCHFGHKAERWHPKAQEFIYMEKDGIHIIDLAKTKAGLEAAIRFVTELISSGNDLLFVGTKRQARGILAEESKKAGAPYLSERWIGGFLTNWEGIKKNIEKINTLTQQRDSGGWKKFPKHEQVKLAHFLSKADIFYGGVLRMKNVPQALFVVDIKKEISAIREAQRVGIPVVAVVDTNSDPAGIDYVIPANDDAVGSIQFIVHAIAQVYKEAREKREKDAAKVTEAAGKPVVVTEVSTTITPIAPERTSEGEAVALDGDKAAEVKSAAAAVKKTKGRPKKADVKTQNANVNMTTET